MNTTKIERNSQQVSTYLAKQTEVTEKRNELLAQQQYSRQKKTQLKVKQTH